MRARGPVGYTCPKIDACIDMIKSVVEGGAGWSDLDILIGRNGVLEKIRSDNEALRDWGSAEEDRASELDATVAQLESENETLRAALEDAQSQMAEFT